MYSEPDSLQIIDTLRRLNRIFVRTRTTGQLLNELCKTVVSTPPYVSAWIVLLRRNKEVVSFAHEGLEEAGAILGEFLSEKGLNYCLKLSVEKKGLVFIENSKETCADCPVFGANLCKKTILLPIHFQEELLGMMALTVNEDHQLSELEESILSDFSEDLGNALNTIRLEEEKEKLNNTVNHIVKSISGKTSLEVLNSFMLNMVKSLDSDYAFIGKLVPGYKDRIKTISVSTPDGIIDNFEYLLAGTPCEKVISQDICCYAEGVADLFPGDKLLKDMEIDAYIGAPLFNSMQKVTGIMVVLKKTPFPSESLARSIFQVFASRASTELMRYDTEQRIMESEHQYQELIESSVNPIYIIVGNRLALVNSAWLDMFEYTRKEVGSPDFSIHQIVAPESMDLIQQRLENFLAGISQPFRYELKAVTKSGRKLELDVSVTHLNWQGKRAVQGVYRNITEIKRTEDKLRAAMKESQEHARMTTAFLKSLSQEIKCSISGIFENAKVIQAGKANNVEVSNFAGQVLNDASLILDQINDIIDISNIELGRITLKPEKIILAGMLQDIIRYFQPLAQKKGIELSCCKKQNDSLKVMADPTHLRQILLNLVGNAVKFTNQGKVQVGYNIRQEDVRVSITDTGIGIPPEKQKTIFKSFLNTNEKLTGNYDGSGLGLTIAHSLVQMMGGKIWVESNSGGGSIFYFTIPLA